MEPDILNKDTILKHCTEKDIFISFAMNHGMLANPNDYQKKNVSSPFTEDKKPSFSFYKDGNTHKFKCNSSGKQGDVWQFVADLNDLDCKHEFSEVLKVIANQMNIGLQTSYNKVGIDRKDNQKHQNRGNIAETIELQSVNKDSQNSFAKPDTDKKLSVVKRQIFRDIDLQFWDNLGVAKQVLDKFKVHSISSYNFPDKKASNIKKEAVAFAYEMSGNYKLYIPEQKSLGVEKKVLPPFKSGIFGLEQLPKGNVKSIIICEGEKDVIVAHSRGFNAVTFGSSAIHIKPEQIKALQSRCEQLFICYDNDKAGVSGTNRIVEQYPSIIPVQLPDSTIANYDITDYFQEHTSDEFQEILILAAKSKGKVEKQESYGQYELPKEVTTPINELIEDIEKYRMFIANHQIWMMQGDTKKSYFKSVSNFEIEIIQHMQDEKTPLKLVRIKNTFNQEHVFDIPSEKLNTPQKFDDTITGFGNFLWFGSAKDFQTLRAYLFDKMGAGKKIDCLGWQKENEIWIWNNRVNLCNGHSLEIDSNGIFKHNDSSYYIPSANKIYKNNPFKFDSQKNVCLFKAAVPLEVYLQKMMEVHRHHSITAILFTISSIFQDIIVKEVKGFPILFLQGLTSSGKDQLSNCCQSFFGKPQAAINVEAGVSTAKAHIREFAQFSNIICQFSEYKNGDKQLDGILKGIWDRNGYKRGNIDSGVATDTVPILSSLILTSNYFPDDEPLITRLLWVDMNKNEFTKAEIEKYNELADITNQGISSYTDEILHCRKLFNEKFIEEFRKSKETFSELIPNIPSRFSTNYSILSATFKVLKDVVKFPFTQSETMQYFQRCIESQMNKMKSTSIINKWWDCMLIAVKTNNENKLEFDKDIKIEGNNLYFNFTNSYNKIQRQWYLQYKESIPSKVIIQEQIKKDKSFIETKSSFRFGTGKDGSNTSAYVIDINLLPVAEEFNDAISFIFNIP